MTIQKDFSCDLRARNPSCEFRVWNAKIETRGTRDCSGRDDVHIENQPHTRARVRQAFCYDCVCSSRLTSGIIRVTAR